MKRSNLIIPWFCIISIGFNTSSTIDANISWSNVGEKTITAGTILVGIGGLISLGNWLFGETDKELFEKSNNLYHTVDTQYHAIITWFEQSSQIYAITPQEYDRVIKNFSEELLHQVAAKIWYLNEYEATYRSHLRTTIKTLRNQKRKLNKQIGSIRKQHQINSQANHLLHDMELLEQAIQNQITHLTFFSDYLEHHSSYLALYEYEGIVRKEYQTELELLTHYAYNRFILVQKFKNFITKKKNNSYPCLAYINRLNIQLNKIKQRKFRLAYNYIGRISWTQQVIDSLEYIKDIVVNDFLYQQELRAQEQERLEHKRIALIQEQLDLEKKKLSY